MKTKKPLFRDKPKAELDAIAARDDALYDQENFIDRTRPLTPEQRAEWERVRPLPLRGKKAATQRISMAIKKKLVARADAAAKKLHTDRTSIVERGIEMVLEAIEAK